MVLGLLEEKYISGFAETFLLVYYILARGSYPDSIVLLTVPASH